MPKYSHILKKSILASSPIIFALFLSGCTALGATRPAALQITSTPQASVFLDGKHVGKSPFFSDQLKNREYLVKITSGEATHSEKITLSEGTLTVVNWELNNNFLAQSGEILSLEPGEKGLFVISMPQEADLEVDGKFIGKTPTKIEDIEDGEHKITLKSPGYLDREFVVKTSKDYQLVADVTLASEIAKGVAEAPAPLPELEKVEVLNTPLGFLRVRRDSSLSSPEVGRVQTGDELEIIQETEDWIQIKFEGKQGWVSAQYVEKLPQVNLLN